MPWAQPNPEYDRASNTVRAAFSIEGNPVRFDVEGQPHLDAINGRQVVFANPTAYDAANPFAFGMEGRPWASTLDGRQVTYSVASDEHGIIGTISTAPSWPYSGPTAAFGGESALQQAADHRSWIKHSREMAMKRARKLLLEHLSEEQRSDYEQHAYFDVPSSLQPGNRFFRLLHQNVSNIHVYARSREDAYPPEGKPRKPSPYHEMMLSMIGGAYSGMSWMGRGSAGTSPTKSEKMRHHRTLCLVPRDYGAPIDDQLLAQKLLIEADEPTMWRTAR